MDGFIMKCSPIFRDFTALIANRAPVDSAPMVDLINLSGGMLFQKTGYK
jgi:hypothetical protein